ncbi:MAG: complex I NDUFA9 subunit family protein [Rhodospirillales bacterium]|nr:complex I NDUFA9 subunit family protein [Rhodospirillales bacterium]
MNQQLVTVFGGNGFVGRHIVQRLARAGHRVRVACRDPESALFLRPLGDPGQIVAVKANVASETEVARALEGADWAVNCVGILASTGRNSFSRVHETGAANVAHAAKAAGVRALVQISALGAAEDAKSKYAKSKARGELAVLKAFPEATILRPSIIVGPEDGFFNLFAAISRWSPVVPIVGCPILPKFKMVRGLQTQWLFPSFEFCDFGGTRFQPIYVGDVADAALQALAREPNQSAIYELTGPKVYTFRRLMELMLRETGHNRMIVPYPVPLAYLTALFAELIPGKPFTRDQVHMLKTDNVASGKHKTLAHLGLEPRGIESVLPSYLRSYRPPSKRRLRTSET